MWYAYTKMFNVVRAKKMRLSVKKKMDGTREVHVKRKKNIYFLNTKIVFTLTYGTYEETHKKMSSN